MNVHYYAARNIVLRQKEKKYHTEGVYEVEIFEIVGLI